MKIKSRREFYKDILKTLQEYFIKNFKMKGMVYKLCHLIY